jgi:hypothetical protein
MRAFRAVMAVLLLIGLLPLIGMAAAEFIAQINGCKLDMAGAHPCIVGGSDIGHGLLTLTYMGYFLFLSMPAVVGIVVLWVLVELIAFVRRRTAS